MVVVLTYKRLNTLNYPVFRLPSTNWESKDGLLYVDGLLVDDKNMPGETLGIRRLQTPFKGLLKLSKACTGPIGLIKNPAGPYIDNHGKLFEYEKTKYCKVRYYKIKSIEKKITHSLLWLYRINFPIEIPRPPDPDFKWAGILHLEERPWLLYDYATEKLPEYRRKV